MVSKQKILTSLSAIVYFLCYRLDIVDDYPLLLFGRIHLISCDSRWNLLSHLFIVWSFLSRLSQFNFNIITSSTDLLRIAIIIISSHQLGSSLALAISHLVPIHQRTLLCNFVACVLEFIPSTCPRLSAPNGKLPKQAESW